MAFIDYYKILGLDRTASEADVKKAYRRLARRFHPDLNPNDREAQKKFQQLNEANEVLSDPDKRKKYDAYGENWEHAEEIEKMRRSESHSRGRSQTGNTQGWSESYTGSFNEDEFSDFFETLFGSRRGHRRRRTQYRGHDYNAELQLTLRDVYHTHKRTLTIDDKNIRIEIPAGVKDGQLIKLKGYGAPGIDGGPNGDLFLKFKIDQDAEFRRVGSDLYKTEVIELYDAVLGGEVVIRSFDGKVKLKVEPGTQSGAKVKLKGKGFPKYRKSGEFGDLYITFEVRIPTNLTEEQEFLFKKLAKR